MINICIGVVALCMHRKDLSEAIEKYELVKVSTLILIYYSKILLLSFVRLNVRTINSFVFIRCRFYS